MLTLSRERGDYTAKEQADAFYKHMIYYSRLMYKMIRPAYFLTLFILIVLSCATIAFSTKPNPAVKTSDVSPFFQTTATPPNQEETSEVGSTDEIVLMGGVISAIILIPILLQRRAWEKESQP